VKLKSEEAKPMQRKIAVVLAAAVVALAAAPVA